MFLLTDVCLGFRVHFHGAILHSKSTGQHQSSLKTAALMMYSNVDLDCVHKLTFYPAI